MLQINRIIYDKSIKEIVKNNVFEFETKLNLDRFLEVNKEMVLAEENKRINVGINGPELTQKSPKIWKSASYELTNVVIHSGVFGSGHYYVYGKSQGNWFKFNDSKVTKENEEIMMKDARGEIKTGQNVYALFYTLVEDESIEPVPVIRKMIV